VKRSGEQLGLLAILPTTLLCGLCAMSRLSWSGNVKCLPACIDPCRGQSSA
jgi:hypothetical protein